MAQILWVMQFVHHLDPGEKVCVKDLASVKLTEQSHLVNH